uniref:Uncharacterized protein n=1 Tax=Oryza barthii TaxID=65489 RepID=A0A0D3HI74_9ORYZ
MWMGGYDLRRNLKRDEKTDFVRMDSKKQRNASLARKKEEVRVCNEGETSESLISGNLHFKSNEGVFRSEFSGEVASNMSKSVVSLALLDGMVVQRDGHVIKLLTSASLLKAFNDESQDHDNLKVEVHHKDAVVIGSLREYHLDHNMAAVVVENLPDLRPVPFNNVQKFVPHSMVVALGRDISGKLMATGGLLIGGSSGSYNPKLMSSTCKFSEVYEGGPLFDFDGDFLGMNLSLTTEGTLFVPGDRVLDQLVNWILHHEVKFAARLAALKALRSSFIYTFLNKDQYGDLESLGYPEPPISNDGMILANTFEEPFGNVCGKGVWSELSEDVASNICENIVALASFNGEKRSFACTGFFIEWNECATILTSANLLRDPRDADKIIKNLRIKVLLPNNRRTKGTVQHYNLRYNVALVSVKDYRVLQPVKIQPYRHYASELLAVGCIFKSGRLMASRGRQLPIGVTHDRKFLGYSQCTITKVGIGGPLLGFDGNFVGMNFYDEGVVGTPFLSWCEICEILKYFKTKGTVAEHRHGNPSDVLDWKIVGDDSVFPARYYDALLYCITFNVSINLLITENY